MKATKRDNGDEWAASRDGKLQIRLQTTRVYGQLMFEVSAIYTGTHDLAPRTRSFHSETGARSYANSLWSL